MFITCVDPAIRPHALAISFRSRPCFRFDTESGPYILGAFERPLCLVIAIPGSGIEKFVIPDSWILFRDKAYRLVVILVSPIDIFYAQGRHKRYIRTVESDSDCQNTNFWR